MTQFQVYFNFITSLVYVLDAEIGLFDDAVADLRHSI